MIFSILEDVVSTPQLIKNNLEKQYPLHEIRGDEPVYLQALTYELKQDSEMLYEVIQLGENICENLAKKLEIEHKGLFGTDYLISVAEFKDKLDNRYPNDFLSSMEQQDTMVTSNGK